MQISSTGKTKICDGLAHLAAIRLGDFMNAHLQRIQLQIDVFQAVNGFVTKRGVF